LELAGPIGVPHCLQTVSQSTLCPHSAQNGIQKNKYFKT
jgi:hypothetical protein